MKKLKTYFLLSIFWCLGFSLILSVSKCAYYDTTGFTQYTPENVEAFKETLRIYYQSDLKSLSNERWFFGPLERVREECSSDLAVACVYSDKTIFMTEEFVNQCWVELHELMHIAMREVYDHSDKDHLLCDWEQIPFLCNWTYNQILPFPEKCKDF